MYSMKTGKGEGFLYPTNTKNKNKARVLLGFGLSSIDLIRF